MEYKKLHNANLNVSAIALGTWVFGGDMWGGSKEQDCISAVKAAIDMGVNLIDTAPVYGFGRAETIVGKAIKGKRDKVVIATKCGLIRQGKRILNNLSPESINKEIDDSLLRLGVDYVDIYQLHWPDPATPLEKTIDCLKALQAEGKIKHIGISNFDKALMNRATGLTKIATAQNQYSILDRSAENDVIPTAIEIGAGVIAYGSLGGGILTGKYNAASAFPGTDARSFFYHFYEKEEFPQIQKLLNVLQTFNRPLNQIAINWARDQKGIASVIVGCRNRKQAEENFKAAEWKLSPAELTAIQNASKELK